MCLTLEFTILASTTEIKLVLYYKYTSGAPVWSAKDSIYLVESVLSRREQHQEEYE